MRRSGGDTVDKRLLVVSDSLRGGLGLAVRSHVEWFTHNGWDVRVAAPATTEIAPVPGHQPVPIPVTVRDVAGVLRASRHIRDMCAAGRPDVVHCHGARSFAVTRLARRKAPFLTIHGINPVSSDPAGYRFLRHPGLTGVSLLAAGAFAVYPGPPPGFRFVPHASGRLATLAPLPPPPRSVPTFLWVGALDEPKRPDLFVSAISDLAGRQLPVRGVMAGSGPKEPQVRAQIERLGAPIELAGQVTDIESLLQPAWAVVLLSDSEGVPFALEEAMWVGRPFVATPLAGTRWLAGSDGRAGQLAARPDEITRALERLCDFDHAVSAGESAAQRIRTLLRPDDPWPSMARAYQQQRAAEHVGGEAEVRP